MKKIALLVVLAGMVGVAGYLLVKAFEDKPLPKFATEPAPSVLVPETSKPSPRFQAMQTEARAPLPAPQRESLSAQCLEFLNAVRGINLNQTTGRMQLPAAKGCTNLPAALKPLHDEYTRDCANFSPAAKEPDRMQQNALCLFSLNKYRANMTEWLTRDIPLKDITDPKILADKLMARLLTDPTRVSEVAERLLELEPDLPNVAKTLALGRFMEATHEGTADQTKAWNRVDDAIALASRTNPNDPKLAEMELVSGLMRHKDPTALRNRMEQVRLTNPDLGDYLLSWMEYKTGQSNQAVERLEAMQRRGNKDPRIAKSIESIQKKEPNAFEFSVQFPNDILSPQPETTEGKIIKKEELPTGSSPSTQSN